MHVIAIRLCNRCHARDDRPGTCGRLDPCGQRKGIEVIEIGEITRFDRAFTFEFCTLVNRCLHESACGPLEVRYRSVCDFILKGPIQTKMSHKPLSNGPIGGGFPVNAGLPFRECRFERLGELSNLH